MSINGPPRYGSSANTTQVLSVASSPANASDLAPRALFVEPSLVAHEPEFTFISGPLPFVQPNIRSDHADADLTAYINSGGNVDSGNNATSAPTDTGDGCWCTVCACIPIIGWCYLCCAMKLVNQGQYGFSLLNGTPRIYTAGRHWVANPLNDWQGVKNIGDDQIVQQPITITRVVQGQYGLAMNNSQPEILLPGIHARISTAFKFRSYQSTDEDLIEFGPVKIFMVKSGEVRVCFDKGKVVIFHEGRYCVNNAAFRVVNNINTQQQNMRFSKHPVLLDGGIGLLVEGLLTFKVVDVEMLIKELGDMDLKRAIEDVTKAEISRVFAGIHLEQISSATVNPSQSTVKKTVIDPKTGQNITVLGVEEKESGEREGEERSKLCGAIITSITPICSQWGVKVINFQLESTKIADEKYASEYEQASLGMAKAKANLRSVDAENEIVVRRSAARARALQISADGRRESAVIQASAEAEARKIDSEARHAAAQIMTDPFAMQYAFAGQQVQFAEALQAQSLTVISHSGAGQTLIPMFSMIQNNNDNSSNSSNSSSRASQ